MPSLFVGGDSSVLQGKRVSLGGHQALSIPIQPFNNVDLYSLMAEILKIKPATVRYRGRYLESKD
jgi:hypothetical protein